MTEELFWKDVGNGYYTACQPYVADATDTGPPAVFAPKTPNPPGVLWLMPSTPFHVLPSARIPTARPNACPRSSWRAIPGCAKRRSVAPYIARYRRSEMVAMSTRRHRASPPLRHSPNRDTLQGAGAHAWASTLYRSATPRRPDLTHNAV